MPIPRAAPAAASATSASTPMPALTTPYPYQAAPPVTRERGVSGTGRRGGLSGIASTFILIIVCLLIGGGIYYFINQNGPSAPIDNTVDITPPSIQNVKISATTATGATITWKTDESTTDQFEYGKTEEYGSTAPPDTNLTASHSVTLTRLDPDTTYYFKVTSKDATGNETTSEGELRTSAQADETPPTISGVNVSNITESSAIVTWITDETATSQVKYGETETYGSETAENTNLSTSHSVALTGLDDGTTYNFQVISKDSGGNTATSPNQTFETPAGIPVGWQVGNRAPDFTVQNLDGEDVEVKLSDFRGKIVMINFWAVWCEPCLEEMPNIQAISDNWSNADLAILSIASNYGEGIDDVNEFIEDEGYTFPVFYDSEGQAKSLYSISVWPTTFFIDTEGIIRHIKFERFDDQAEIEDMLDSL